MPVDQVYNKKGRPISEGDRVRTAYRDDSHERRVYAADRYKRRECSGSEGRQSSEGEWPLTGHNTMLVELENNVQEGQQIIYID
ncbi:hypothetical protein N7462_006271 [Penicillium macrosclerotiorum]|uniref:uncharacterized protein n=1 Tax=Penicillium macrosclerotiorum TaxID=303699 RepID=UPI002548D931|nr:uncharacterized protein N7462_006271 [Penicillium macrosclerotiorum]KAJ5683106.1 hypothetical protein N7462_006271 [Penicillium macrosclerotiorum]